MFKTKAERQAVEVLPGIHLKPLVYGDKTLSVEFTLEAGRELPLHSHPYEQTGYLVSGKMQMTIGHEIFDIAPGDSWNIPSDVEHNAVIIEDAVAIEVFSPLREDYLPENLYR